MNLLNNINQTMTTLIQMVQQSVVRVGNGRSGFGAGIIWHSDGLILTNAHVVQRRRDPEVTLADGRSFPAQLLTYDETTDLAALYIAANQLPTIELGHSSQLKTGDWVVAVGHPWGVIGAAAWGTVIAVGQPLEQNGYHGELVQLGIQLRPGHSGGPLVDGNGRLVGINTMISGPQVGLAIPVDVAKKFLQEKMGSAAEAA
ncbi:MAG: trypsin-like peptidase domain-containing protein [Ardenticatenaceae bacterium]|nr:trypsin-like peptidase domain-containing protein [Ardenticatenaceae bacterium]